MATPLPLPLPPPPPPPPGSSPHPPRRGRDDRGQEMDSPPVPGDLLVDIFLRLPDPADLVRASAACVSFRRLVAHRSFLRRYRTLHAPPLLGFLVGRAYFDPATAPHPSAPAASAVALAADFSFAFLPGRGWLIQDSRDGRVLLHRIHRKKGTASTFIQIVACDPLHRQYLELPPIPDEVFPSVEKWQAFLVPPAHTSDKEEETAFRVIWMARRGDQLIALVFSSTTGQWQAGPSHSWSDSFSFFLSATFSLPQYAYGCFYWATSCKEKLLVLDTRRMEFSITDAPPEAEGCDYWYRAIVEAGEGRPGMFVLPPDTTGLTFIIMQNNGGTSGQWQLEKTISLGVRYTFAGSTGRLLFLQHQENGNFFSLDVKTFQLETVSVPASKYICRMFCPRAYSNFPPSLLSSPTVASGVELGTEKETVEQGIAASSSGNG